MPADNHKSSGPSLGEIAFNKNMSDHISHSNVDSGSGITGGNVHAQSGMFAPATGNNTIWGFAQSANVNSMLSHEGMDGLIATGSSDNLLDNVALDRLTFGISHPGLDVSNEITAANLQQATSFTAMSGFDAKKIGAFTKEGEGQGH